MLVDEDKENTKLLKNIITLKSASLKVFTEDYTYWDDMLLFASTGDTAWATENIVASAQTYKSDYAWVFDKNFRLTYFFSASGNLLSDSALISADIVRKLTGKNRFFEFFAKSDSGIVEIRGATIHPTSDPLRITDPGGYFVVGRLWSEQWQTELSSVTNSSIEIIDPKMPDNSGHDGSWNSFQIKSLLMLKDWQQKPIASVQSSREATIIKIIHKQVQREFYIIVIFISGVLVLVSLSLYYLVNLPLKKISRSLKENNPLYLSGLTGKGNEFGEMARLVGEFFLQKKELLKKIEEQAEAEEKIRQSEEVLKHSLKEKEVLLKEVHHRVKNNLQIIISLIRLQTSRIANRVTVEQLHTSLNRIKSIALVHEMLYGSHDLANIDFGIYIQKITSSLRDIYLSSQYDIKIDISANNVFLGVDSAVPCAIIINELVTNAIKHAFGRSKKGNISISLNTEGGFHVLNVHDNGIGMSKEIDIYNTESLGMHLISSLTEQLDGTLSVRTEGGTSFTLKFKEEI